MLFMVVAGFIVAQRDLETQFASALIKMFTACMLLQPFVHVSGGRYWTVFAPLFALALGFVITVFARSRVSTASADIASQEVWQLRLMVWVQALFIVALVAIRPRCSG